MTEDVKKLCQRLEELRKELCPTGYCHPHDEVNIAFEAIQIAKKLCQLLTTKQF